MSLSIACLCANWCNTCKEFEALFWALRDQREQDHFVWVDIETHEDWLDGRDVHNFPTILMLDHAGELCFAGPITPHRETLARLCQAADHNELRLGQDPDDWSAVAQALIHAAS